MHVKIINPRGWDFESTTTELVKVASSGELRGNDRAAFVKRASGSENVFLPFLDNIKFAKDETLIHSIAMGSSDIWGPNRNGDAFTKEANRKYHKTFEKYAKWFRNHKNKDKDPHFGVIKCAAYNEKMHRIELLVGLNATKEAADRNGGFVADKELEKLARGDDIPGSMACFLPGTPVGLADGTEQAIDQIALGTKVITHHGNVGEVDQLMTREYDGELVSFRASGLPDAVVSTSNHRIWVRPTAKGKPPVCPVCNKQFRSLTAHLRQQKDAQHQAAYKDYGRYAEGWVRAENLCVGDYVRTPFSTEVEEEGDTTYAELLGYYLSKGNTFYYKKHPNQAGVDFSFNSLELDFVARVCELLKLLGYEKVRTYVRKQNVTIVRVTSPELAARLEADAGRYSYGKRLADKFMRWAPATQLMLLGTFMNGDGCFNKSHNTLVGTTVSRVLAFQLATICWRNGIPARIDGYQPKNKTKRRFYNVIVQESHVQKIPCAKVPESFEMAPQKVVSLSHLKHQVGATALKTRSVTLSYVEQGFVYRRIGKLSREYYCGPVHNIAVTVDSSYTVNGVAVSNCRVPMDRCSWCGNLAKTRAEYCKAASCEAGGCSDNLTKLVKVSGDLHQVSVYNDEPTHFDYSHVLRPADPTAFGWRADWYEKTASDYSYFEIGSSKTASELGIIVPSRVYREMDTITGNAYHDELLKLAALLQEFEDPSLNLVDDFGLAFNSDIQNTFKLADFISESEHGNMAKVASVLTSLAKEKIILPLKDFASITGREELAKHASVNDIYSRLFESGNIEALVQNSFWTRPSQASNAFQKQARALAPYYSLDPQQVHDRVCLASLRGHQNPLSKNVFGNTKTANAKPEVENLCRDYAMYKLASLYQISDYDNEFALTVSLSQCQNRAS